MIFDKIIDNVSGIYNKNLTKHTGMQMHSNYYENSTAILFTLQSTIKEDPYGHCSLESSPHHCSSLFSSVMFSLVICVKCHYCSLVTFAYHCFMVPRFYLCSKMSSIWQCSLVSRVHSDVMISFIITVVICLLLNVSKVTSFRTEVNFHRSPFVSWEAISPSSMQTLLWCLFKNPEN